MKFSLKHNIVIADDHQIVLDGLVSILSKSGKFIIKGEASNYKEVVSKLSECDCEVLLTDLNMPGMNGVEMVEAVKKQFPFIKIVVLSMYHERTMINRLKEIGVEGYILKHGDKDSLIATLLNIIENDMVEFPETPSIVNSRSFGYEEEDKFNDSFKKASLLGKRELEVLHMVGQGVSNQNMAESMFVSIETIYSHRKHIKGKLDFKHNSELAAFAVQYNLSHNIY